MTLEPVEEMAGWWWVVLRGGVAKNYAGSGKGECTTVAPQAPSCHRLADYS